RFWILDFRFWIGENSSTIQNPKSKIQNPKSKITPPSRDPVSLLDIERFRDVRGADFAELAQDLPDILALLGLAAERAVQNLLGDLPLFQQNLAEQRGPLRDFGLSNVHGTSSCAGVGSPTPSKRDITP